MRISDLRPEETRAYFESRGLKFHGNSLKQVVRCALHGEKKPSLSIDLGKAVWRCWAGCGEGGLIAFEKKYASHDDTQRALKAIFEATGNPYEPGVGSEEEPERIYTYTDEHNILLFQKLRFAGVTADGRKRFIIRKPAPAGGWVYNSQEVRKVLYNLPGVIAANVIGLCEGEHDADEFNKANISSFDPSGFSRFEGTTNFDGGANWNSQYSHYMAGKDVFIFPHFDKTGIRHSHTVAASIQPFASTVRIVNLPYQKEHEDLADYLQLNSAAALLKEMQKAEIWKPTKSRLLVSASEFLAQEDIEIQWLLTGVIQRGANGFIVASPKGGKAQPVDSLVLTHDGWRTMGEIEVGDEVIGGNGSPVPVIAVHPQGVKPCYRVGFSDGSSVEATADHLWKIQSHDDRRNSGRWEVRSTEFISLLLATGKKRETHIPTLPPVQYPHVDLPISPYLMGVILGDGGITQQVSITSGDSEIFDIIGKEIPAGMFLRPWPNQPSVSIVKSTGNKKQNGSTLNPLVLALKKLGLMGKKSIEKHIPELYLRADIAQRLSLLRGLMDTDGTISKKGKPSFSTSSEQLAKGTKELIESLGGVATINRKSRGYKKLGIFHSCNDSYEISVKLPRELGCPFRIQRKSKPWKESRHGLKKPPTRRIVSVQYSRKCEAKCITVDSCDGLYVTENHIVTHNSYCSMDMAIALALGRDWMEFHVPKRTKVAYITREDTPPLTKWRMRKLLATWGVTERDIEDWLHLNSKDQSPQFKLDVPEQFNEMLAALKQFGPEIVFLDVLNIMHSSEENDNTEMRKVLDKADELGRELSCSISVLHHFNKEVKARLTERIRGASSMSGWVEWVIGLHKDKDEDDEDTLRWAEFDLKAASPPNKMYFKIQGYDSLGVVVPRGADTKDTARIEISREQAPVKTKRNKAVPMADNRYGSD